MNPETKKNILDLHFQKHLIIASTAIFIGFTYLVGLAIALMTNQINFRNFVSWIILITISAFFVSFVSILFFKSRYHLKNIPEVIKSLDHEQK